jgi:hypothetical protein
VIRNKKDERIDKGISTNPIMGVKSKFDIGEIIDT